MDDQFPDTSSTEAPDYTLRHRDHRIYRLIFFLLSFIEVLLGFRFILKFLGANPGSVFASLIYTLSEPLTAPFLGMFPPAVTEGVVARSVFDPSVAIAMIAYAVLAWGGARLFLIFRSRPKH